MGDGEKNESMFAFNPDASVRSVRVGECPIVVTVADDVLLRPQQLAEFGQGLTFVEDDTNLYPGVRARVPAEFSRPFHAWLTRTLQRTSVLEEGCYINDDASFFSIVNKSRADLLPLQRIPHYDSADPRVFAAVIYLFDRANSGTSFYRHRSTGYEKIGDDNAGNYKIALNRNMKQFGPPAREYTNGSNALFERMHSVESAFNRIVIYSGNVLHAADIDGSLVSGNDNSQWRLTISSLIKSTSRPVCGGSGTP
jgi:plasmid maintenance system killer protein